MFADRLCSSALALLVLLATPAFAADPNAAAPAEPRALALAKAHEGLSLYQAERWEEAYARFQEADRLYHAPTVTLYLARCHRKLGRLDDARATYEKLLAEPLPSDAPPPFIEARRDAERELDEVHAELARSSPRNTDAPSTPSQKGTIVPGVAALGLGAVALGVGAVTGLLSLSKVADLDARCPDKRCPLDARPDADSAEALGNVSTVAFIVGGAAAAAGAVLLVIRPAGSAPTATSAGAASPAPEPRWSAGVGLGRVELRATF